MVEIRLFFIIVKRPCRFHKINLKRRSFCIERAPFVLGLIKHIAFTLKKEGFSIFSFPLIC
jgi:hypothetical protein